MGVVRGAYGIKGWIRVTPFSTDAEALTQSRRWWLKSEGLPPQPLEVEAVRRHSGSILAKWVGLDVPEQCEALKGSTIALERAEFPRLPEGEAYWVDLIGARVVNRAGVILGEVAGVQDNRAQDLMAVKTAAGELLLIPMVANFIDAIDAKSGEVRVDWEPEWS